MKEKWVRINTIEGYEDVKDYYYLSNSDEDKIINKNTGKQMKIGFDKDGYKIIGLMTINGKQKICKIHVIKAKAFIFGPNTLGYNIVRHLNDIKTDNALTNLAWGTQSDNMRDCIRNGSFNYKSAAKNGKKGAKKTSKPVRCIETGVIYPSTKEAGRQIGIANGSISHCCSGKCKIAGGFHWEYVDPISES